MQGVVEVKVIGVSTRYGPSDATAVAVSVVAASAVGTASTANATVIAASFPSTCGLLWVLVLALPSPVAASGPVCAPRTCPSSR